MFPFYDTSACLEQVQQIKRHTQVLHEMIDILIWIYSILRFDLNDTKYQPFQGSTFSHFLVQIVSCDNLKRRRYNFNTKKLLL